MTEPSHFLMKNIGTLVTMNPDREVVTDAWIAATGGMITAVGQGPVPELIGKVPRSEFSVHDATGCVVLPGLINTHHHLFQTRTRAWSDAVDSELFDWLKTLYPVWAKLSDEQFYQGALVGFREMLRSGCTLTTDHHYLFPVGASPELRSSSTQRPLAEGLWGVKRVSSSPALTSKSRVAPSTG